MMIENVTSLMRMKCKGRARVHGRSQEAYIVNEVAPLFGIGRVLILTY